MASANSGWFNTGSGPTVQVRCEVEAKRPNAYSETIQVWWTVRMRIVSGGGWLGTGVINVSSAVWSAAGNHSNQSGTIKAASDRWTDTSEHQYYGGPHSFSWGGAVTLTIKFSSSGAYSTSGIFSNKEVKVTVPAPASTKPNPPTNVKVPSPQHFNTGFKITWTKPSKTYRDIKGYDVQGRAYNGSSWSDWVVINNAQFGNVGEYSMGAPRTLNYGNNTVGSYLGATKFQFRVRTSDWTEASSWTNSNEMSISKKGKICCKDTNGSTHEVTRVRVKDTGGTVRTVTAVKVKDTGGTVHNIELYY